MVGRARNQDNRTNQYIWMRVTTSDCHASEIIAAGRHSNSVSELHCLSVCLSVCTVLYYAQVYPSLSCNPNKVTRWMVPPIFSPVESHASFPDSWMFRLPFLLARSPNSPCATPMSVEVFLKGGRVWMLHPERSHVKSSYSYTALMSG
jgi:hypothetical protein